MTAFKTAKWIFADVSDKVQDRYYIYKDTFTVEQTENIIIHLSAHSKYALYINGVFVDCGQYADYEDYQVYDTLNLTEHVRVGENELEIQQYVCGTEFFTERPAIPGVIYEVLSSDRILAESQAGCMVRENTKYLSRCERINSQLSYNFDYDARVEDAPYHPAIEIGKEKNLYPRPIHKLNMLPYCEGRLYSQGVFLDKHQTDEKAVRMQLAYLSFYDYEELFEGIVRKPILSANPLKDYSRRSGELTWHISEERESDGAYLVFDLGDEMAGYLSLSLTLSEGTEVLVSFGEHLDDLRVRSSVDGRAFCYRYIAKEGRNDFLQPFHRMGLRYLQVHVYSQTGTLHSVGIRPVEYPVVVKPKKMKDRFHQKIREIGIRTLLMCMHEHYEDCPWREQSFYNMDSRNQMLCGYEVFEGYEFQRAALLLMAKSLRKDGLLEMCAPGKCFTNIPSFTAIYPRAVLEYMEHSGDVQMGAELLPVIRTVVDGFRARIEANGLIANYEAEDMWNFYEWREGLDGENLPKEKIYDAPLNTFVSDAFHCTAQICSLVKPELSETYERLHKQLNAAMHEAFYDEQAGAYWTRKQDGAPMHALTQGLMLYVGAVPTACEDAVCDSIKSQRLIPASLSMTIYVFEGLLQHGNHREYVLNEIDRIWGNMVWNGAKTFWETDAGAEDFWRAGSLCHGWSALPIYIFQKYYPELIESE